MATRIVSVRDNVVDTYPGTYRDFLDHAEKVARAAREPEASAPKKKGAAAAPVLEKKAAYEENRVATREKERKKRRLAELEALVAAGEASLAALREELRAVDPAASWEALAERAEQEQALAKNVEALLEEWMSLGEELASLEATR